MAARLIVICRWVARFSTIVPRFSSLGLCGCVVACLGLFIPLPLGWRRLVSFRGPRRIRWLGAIGSVIHWLRIRRLFRGGVWLEPQRLGNLDRQVLGPRAVWIELKQRRRVTIIFRLYKGDDFIARIDPELLGVQLPVAQDNPFAGLWPQFDGLDQAAAVATTQMQRHLGQAEVRIAGLETQVECFVDGHDVLIGFGPYPTDLWLFVCPNLQFVQRSETAGAFLLIPHQETVMGIAWQVVNTQSSGQCGANGGLVHHLHLQRVPHHLLDQCFVDLLVGRQFVKFNPRLLNGHIGVSKERQLGAIDDRQIALPNERLGLQFRVSRKTQVDPIQDQRRALFQLNGVSGRDGIPRHDAKLEIRLHALFAGQDLARVSVRLAIHRQ